MKKQKVFVCSCHLSENRRMVSEYLVIAKNKRVARLAMKDGEHVVDSVSDLSEYVIDNGNEWINLTSEQETQLLEKGLYCLMAGT